MIIKAITGVWSTSSKVAEKEIQIRLDPKFATPLPLGVALKFSN
jgi:hypothetical protein